MSTREGCASVCCKGSVDRPSVVRDHGSMSQTPTTDGITTFEPATYGFRVYRNGWAIGRLIGPANRSSGGGWGGCGADGRELAYCSTSALARQTALALPSRGVL